MPDPELSRAAQTVLTILRDNPNGYAVDELQKIAEDQCSDQELIAALEELNEHHKLVLPTLGNHWQAFPSAFGQ